MQDRRKKDRVKTRGLSTPFGEVIDVSESGIGVFRKGRVDLAEGDEVGLIISNDFGEVQTKARVVRVSKVGLFRHEIGLRFIETALSDRIKVMAMAESGCSEFAGPRCWVAA